MNSGPKLAMFCFPTMRTAQNSPAEDMSLEKRLFPERGHKVVVFRACFIPCRHEHVWMLQNCLRV